MDSKIAITIAIAAIVAIGGAVAAILIINGNSGKEDKEHVYYYHNEDSLALKTKDTTVKDQSVLNNPECFLTWNTKADRSGDYYNPGDEVKLGTKLYAIWGTHYMSIGDTMNIVSDMKLGLTVSDDISEHRSLAPIIGLSDKGEATFAISGWYNVEVHSDRSFKVRLHEGGNYIEMMPDADGATSIELWTEGTTAYFKIKYDNTCNLTVSVTEII